MSNKYVDTTTNDTSPTQFQGRKLVRCMHIGSLNKSAKWQAALLLSDVDTRHGSVLWSEKSCPALIYELSIKKKGEEVV